MRDRLSPAVLLGIHLRGNSRANVFLGAGDARFVIPWWSFVLFGVALLSLFRATRRAQTAARRQVGALESEAHFYKASSSIQRAFADGTRPLDGQIADALEALTSLAELERVALVFDAVVAVWPLDSSKLSNAQAELADGSSPRAVALSLVAGEGELASLRLEIGDSDTAYLALAAQHDPLRSGALEAACRELSASLSTISQRATGVTVPWHVEDLYPAAAAHRSGAG